MSCATRAVKVSTPAPVVHRLTMTSGPAWYVDVAMDTSKALRHRIDARMVRVEEARCVRYRAFSKA